MTPAAVARHHVLQEIAQFAADRAKSSQEALQRLKAAQDAAEGPRPVGMAPRPPQGDDAAYLAECARTAEGIANRLRATPGYVIED